MKDWWVLAGFLFLAWVAGNFFDDIQPAYRVAFFVAVGIYLYAREVDKQIKKLHDRITNLEERLWQERYGHED